jgi:5'-nucleotidase
MRLLLTNDDGIEASGLRALEASLEATAECWVIAPAREQSAGGHALSLRRPVHVDRLGERRFAVHGSPADCVYLGLQLLCQAPFDAVVSGINRGANLALDVYYSGTVAAAREAAMWGIPALAVSLFVDNGRPSPSPCWASAAGLAGAVLRDLLARGLPPEVLLSLNVPDLPPERIRGIRLARLGRRRWSRFAEERRDGEGRPHCWLGGTHLGFDGPPDSDGHLIEEGWAALCPLQLDCTADSALAGLAAWDALQR